MYRPSHSVRDFAVVLSSIEPESSKKRELNTSTRRSRRTTIGKHSTPFHLPKSVLSQLQTTTARRFDREIINLLTFTLFLGLMIPAYLLPILKVVLFTLLILVVDSFYPLPIFDYFSRMKSLFTSMYNTQRNVHSRFSTFLYCVYFLHYLRQ